MGIRQAIHYGFAPVIVEACATRDADLEALGVPVIYSKSHIKGWNKAALTGLSLAKALPYLRTLDPDGHVFFFNSRYKWHSPRPSCVNMIARAEDKDGCCTRDADGGVRTFSITMRTRHMINMFASFDAARAQKLSINYERDVADFIDGEGLDMNEYDSMHVETIGVDIRTGRRGPVVVV